MHTSKAPARLVLTADVGADGVEADGADVALVTVKVVDANGLFVPSAGEPIVADHCRGQQSTPLCCF